MANTKTFGPDMRVGSGTWSAATQHWCLCQGVPGAEDHNSSRAADQDRPGEADVAGGCRARAQVQEVIQDLIVKLDTPLSTGERDRLSREVLHEVFGLGPLEPLLQDATINDILVNTYQKGIRRAWRHTGEDQCGLQGRRTP